MEQRKATPTTKSPLASHVTLTLIIAATFAQLINGAYGHSSNQSNYSTTNNISTRTATHKQTTIGSAQVSVRTSSGLLLGTKEDLNVRNGSIYKFLAVPYAEAPVNELRFKRPVELKSASAQNVVDATKFGKTCPQFRHLTRFISPLLNVDNEHQISEDCLHLNVFVPGTVGKLASSAAAAAVGAAARELEPTRQLPVIVWIPGEGFDFADARQYDASYLAQQTQSVVVTVQYRVGIFGFLRAPKLGATGNMGLYDQLMALRWVSSNINSFGGDSNRVTLMGRFSGSMSISALMTAPVKQLVHSDDGRALFNRAIVLSGIAINDWIIESEQSKKVSEVEQGAVSRSLCTEAQVSDGSCLRELSAEQLLATAGYGWRLVVDNELVGPIAPVDAIKANANGPDLEAVLLGETGQEGTLCLYRHLLMASSNNYAQLIEEDRLTADDVWNMIQDDSLTYFKYNSTPANSSPTQAALRTFMDESIYETERRRRRPNGGAKLRDRYLDACSSYMVKSHSRKFKRNLLARNELDENRMDADKRPVEVFHYELRYKPTFSLAPDYIKTAAHGDDVPLIFGLVHKLPTESANEADLVMSHKMMSYIGNFVHGNNPTHPTIETAFGSQASRELRGDENGNDGNDSNNNNNNDHDDEDDANETADVGGSDMSSNNENSSDNGHLVAGLAEDESPMGWAMQASGFGRRLGWSGRQEAVPIELGEADLREINRSPARVRPRSSLESGSERSIEHGSATNPLVRKPNRADKLNIQLIVFGSPTVWASTKPTKAASALELLDAHHHHHQHHQHRAGAHEILADSFRAGRYKYSGSVRQLDESSTSGSRTKHLIELAARQQQRQQEIQSDEAENWISADNGDKSQMTVIKASASTTVSKPAQIQTSNSAASQQFAMGSTQTTPNFINESSFITILLFSACIVIFALISFCIVLSLIVFRCNVSTSKPVRHQQFDDSSSCNICVDTRAPDQINSALGDQTTAARKNRNLCNVLSRLRSTHHENNNLSRAAAAAAATTTTTTTTTTATDQARAQKQLDSSGAQLSGNHSTTELVMHNRGVNGSLVTSDTANHHS